RSPGTPRSLRHRVPRPLVAKDLADPPPVLAPYLRQFFAALLKSGAVARQPKIDPFPPADMSEYWRRRSARPRDIAEYHSQGFSPREIADRLGVTADTVRYYLHKSGYASDEGRLRRATGARSGKPSSAGVTPSASASFHAVRQCGPFFAPSNFQTAAWQMPTSFPSCF